MSREPERLEKFYDILKRIHKAKYPDICFGQLLMSFQASYGDIFYLEEKDFLKEFEKWACSENNDAESLKNEIQNSEEKSMSYMSFKTIIDITPFTTGISYNLAVISLHPRYLPLAVESLNGCRDKVIKIPDKAINRFGESVPVTAITSSAFRGYSSVTDIILSHNTERIGEGAFSRCTALERIYIPRKVVLIPKNAFSGCKALKDVYFEGTYDEWCSIEKNVEKHEIELGRTIPGTPVHKIEEEKIRRISGNIVLNLANIHFRCEYPQ